MNKELFLTFLKIGGFTLGGGPAMVPMMEREVVMQHGWLSHEEFLDILAVSQATPGIFAVDMASHIGYKLGGIRAGIWASVGMVLPSLVIILCIAIVFSQFRSHPLVEAFFMGVRPAVVALLAAPVFRMARKANITRRNCWIPILSTLLIWLCGVSPAVVIVVAALSGYLWGKFVKGKGSKNNYL